jgi:hypothetical protein
LGCFLENMRVGFVGETLFLEFLEFDGCYELESLPEGSRRWGGRRSENILKVSDAGKRDITAIYFCNAGTEREARA